MSKSKKDIEALALDAASKKKRDIPGPKFGVPKTWDPEWRGCYPLFSDDDHSKWWVFDTPHEAIKAYKTKHKKKIEALMV